MVETTTQHYGWVKPEIAHSPATWGGFLNNDLDAIDSLVWTNQQGLAPIGAITMFAGGTAPSNWLICNGQSLPHATGGAYEALFATIGYTYGGSGANFNLPNLQGVFPFGAGGTYGPPVGGTGGESTHALTWGETGPHYHNIPDPTHTHGAYQNAHSHSIATGGHSHAIHTGAHAHSGVVTGATPSGGAFAGAIGGANLTFGNTSTAGDLGGNTDTAGNLGGYTDVQTPGVAVNAAATGITVTDTQGSGAPHNNLPPYLGLNFIIRYQ